MVSASTPPADDVVDALPLFPLNLVLFPGMVLPLHIFEDRYRRMMATCMEEKTPFGVVLIKEGKEVGAPAIPEAVGTLARILECEKMPDGRMNILCRGHRRFEILDLVQRTPFLTARARLLPEPSGESRAEQLDEVQGQFAMCLRDMERLGNASASDVVATDDPAELAYSIATKLSTSIKLPAAMRQHWLSRETTESRLESILIALRGLNEAMALEIERRASDVGLN